MYSKSLLNSIAILSLCHLNQMKTSLRSFLLNIIYQLFDVVLVIKEQDLIITHFSITLLKSSKKGKKQNWPFLFTVTHSIRLKAVPTPLNVPLGG